MMPDCHVLEDVLESAVQALSGGRETAVLDQLPVPVYSTDADGAVIYWNPACVEFAGRQPSRGDRWCVTHKLFTTTGDPMPKDKCPMADAVRQRRPIRDVIAIAERPDGSRRAFLPCPTPLFGKDGSLRGAVNVIYDVTEEQRQALSDQARRCRRLSGATFDRQTCQVLNSMAEGYERTVATLRPAAAG